MIQRKAIGEIATKPNSAIASQPCSSGHITTDKRKIKDFCKSRQVGISFIRKPLYAIALKGGNS